MHWSGFRRICSVIIGMAMIAACGAPGSYESAVFTQNADNSGTSLNGQKFLVAGLRVSNALISDAKTQELIDHMDEFGTYGINTFSIFFQGSRFGDVKGYNEDATLNATYADRMGQIIEAANARNMVVLVGVLYYGNSKAKWDSWGQAEAEKSVANTIQWLKDNNYRNVFIDVNNEHMAKFDDAGLIAAGKAVDASYVISTGGKETPANSDMSLHHGKPDIPGKYYIESEGTCKGGFEAFGYKGGYWSAYSKDPAIYDYIHIGEYRDWLKERQWHYADSFLRKGQGFIFASTWLQCAPPDGPHHMPGGMGTEGDPGIRWMLEFIKEKVGPHNKEQYDG
jgi:hypothetical protein